MGCFSADPELINYLRLAGRSEEMVDRFEQYYRAQQLFGMPQKGQIDYSVALELDLDTVQPSVAGPKRPQDRVDLDHLGSNFHELFSKPAKEGGYGKSADALSKNMTVSFTASSLFK